MSGLVCQDPWSSGPGCCSFLNQRFVRVLPWGKCLIYEIQKRNGICSARKTSVMCGVAASFASCLCISSVFSRLLLQIGTVRR